MSSPFDVQRQEVREVLRSKTWFGFDLDDTLHDFRGASNTALSSVLSKIHSDHGLNTAEMLGEYRRILAVKTSTAFVDGRTSYKYREERFEGVLDKFQVNYNAAYVDSLVRLYEDALAQALCLKAGAMSLLLSLKKLNKKILILTEGPHDAQEWTLRKLGIREHVDCLATSNQFGVSKVDGLLHKVLDTLQIKGTDLVYIGDNWARDIIPAICEGIYAVHYAEDDVTAFRSYPVKIRTLYDLEAMLGT